MRMEVTLLSKSFGLGKPRMAMYSADHFRLARLGLRPLLLPLSARLTSRARTLDVTIPLQHLDSQMTSITNGSFRSR